MPDYTRDTTFNKDASVTKVRFGADAPLLETELNELQDVMNKLRADIVRQAIHSGVLEHRGDIKLGLDSSNNGTPSAQLALPLAPFATNRFDIGRFTASINGNLIEVAGQENGVNNVNIIKLLAPPDDKPREDLVFLEAWYEEIDSTGTIYTNGGALNNPLTNNMKDSRIGAETSKRVQLKWRIRTVAGVDFNTYVNDGFTASNGTVNETIVLPQGGNVTPLLPPVASALTFYPWYNRTITGMSGKKILLDDKGLILAGDGTQTSKDALKTYDGYVYAIPLFRVYRRPSCGQSQYGEYDVFSPLLDPQVTQRIVDGDRVAYSRDQLKVTVDGESLVNLLGNDGNCEDLNKWTNVYMTLDTSIKLFKTTSFKAINNQYAYKDILCDQTHKYFVSGYNYISSYTSGTAPRMEIRDYGSSTNKTVIGFDTTKLNQWQRVSTIVTGKANGGVRIYIGQVIADTIATSYMDGICVYDLTAMGIDTITDIPTLERMLPFVDGIQASKPVAIKAIGKNLFDGKIVKGYWNGTSIQTHAQRLSTNPMSVESGKTYNLSGITLNTANGWGYSVHCFDSQNNYLGVTAWGASASWTNNTYANCRKILLTFYKAVNSVDANIEPTDFPTATFQVEQGTATAYAPYKASQLIVPSGLVDSLKELPNGVKDTVDFMRGKLIKRVGKTVLNGTENISINATNTNTIEFVSISSTQDKKLGDTNVLSDKFPTVTAISDAEYVRGSGATVNIVISILKSKLTTQDIAGFKAWLLANPVTVYYELATPVEYDINDLVKGRLYVNPETTTFEVEQVSSQKVNPVAQPSAIANGDFSNGTTGWTLANVGTPTVANNEATFTTVAPGASMTKGTISGTIIGNKYYARGKIKATSSQISLNSGSGIKYHSGSGNYELLSNLFTATSTGNGIGVADNRASGWDAVSSKEFMMLDLTSIFGAGNEPSQSWCDKYLEFGTNYTVKSPVGTTALGVQRDLKDSFLGVAGNTGVIPATKYKDGMYEVLYRDPAETHVPPKVTLSIGSLITEIKDGATVGSMALTSTEVPYKKHPDGADLYIKFPPTSDVPVINTDTFTFTTSNTSNLSRIKIGDRVAWIGSLGNVVDYGKIINLSGSNITVQLANIRPSSTFTTANYIIVVNRLDSLYSDVVDKDDITDLRHLVSLTGFNYDKLLNQEWDRLARGENNNY
jgi:hypothetical protein